jgi:hypothetical protein
LKAVVDPQHGYGVLLRIEQIRAALDVEQGVTRALRLEHQGLPTEWHHEITPCQFYT